MLWVLASKKKSCLEHDLTGLTDARFRILWKAALSLAAEWSWESSRERDAANGVSPLLLLELAIFSLISCWMRSGGCFGFPAA